MTTKVIVTDHTDREFHFTSDLEPQAIAKLWKDADGIDNFVSIPETHGGYRIFMLNQVANISANSIDAIEFSPRSKWVQDIHEMHDKFGFHPRIKTMTNDELQMFLKFRIDFLKEELTEMYDAYYEGNSEEIVDALIDLCVVAIGTLDAFDIDAENAWDAVHTANMSKVAGVKPNRPNPLKLPDLNKPEGWTAPSHKGNYGLLTSAFEDSIPEEE